MILFVMMMACEYYGEGEWNKKVGGKMKGERGREGRGRRQGEEEEREGKGGEKGRTGKKEGERRCSSEGSKRTSTGACLLVTCCLPCLPSCPTSSCHILTSHLISSFFWFYFPPFHSQLSNIKGKRNTKEKHMARQMGALQARHTAK